MELLILFFALVLSILLALFMAMRFTPNGLSDFELNRQIHAGDKAAVAEQERRRLLPLFVAVQHLKQLAITVVLFWLLLGTQELWLGLVLAVVCLLLAYTIAARGWMEPVAWGVQHVLEKIVQRHQHILGKLFGWFAPKHIVQGGAGIASRDELRQLIATDAALLSPDDKNRLLGAFDFGSLIVADAMVARDKIVTVDVSETVGPVLLDRLHKDTHNIFVAVKKDIDHIKGLLYMHDLSPLDPDLKDLTEAIRPTVHYLPVNASLQDVLSASLATGRQLFIAVDDHGKTKGLVTLADALKFLNGEALPKVSPVRVRAEGEEK